MPETFDRNELRNAIYSNQLIYSYKWIRPRQFNFLNSGQDSQKWNVGGRKNKNKMVSKGNFFLFSGLDRNGMSGVGKK